MNKERLDAGRVRRKRNLAGLRREYYNLRDIVFTANVFDADGYPVTQNEVGNIIDHPERLTLDLRRTGYLATMQGADMNRRLYRVLVVLAW